FSVWPWNFFAHTTHRALPHARRHSVRCALIHGAGFDRAEIRYGLRTLACDVARFRAAARARVVALFHVAAFQAHAPERDSNTRAFAQRGTYCRRSESADFLERRRQGSSLPARHHLPSTR